MGQALARKTHTVPYIDGRLCKKCGICVALCPTKVFANNDRGEAVVAQANKCASCGLCEALCPDYALTLEEV